jgi:hypothetical protein
MIERTDGVVRMLAGGRINDGAGGLQRIFSTIPKEISQHFPFF